MGYYNFLISKLFYNNVFSILTDKGYSGDEWALRYDITEFSKSKVSLSYLLKNNYTNKVNDLIEHSDVFKYYPSLKNVFVLYLKDITLGGDKFYFSKKKCQNRIYLKKTG